MVPRIHRALPSLLALASFLGAGWGDARGLDPCPHHDRLPAPPLAAAPAPAHDDMQGAMAAGMPGHTPGGGHEEHGPCTCVGRCDVGGSHALTTPFGAAMVQPLPRVVFEVSAPPARDAHPAADRWSPYLPHAPPPSV